MGVAPGNDAELLRAYLAGRDVRCQGCGYNLRGLAGEACPECSSPLSLTIQTDEPFRRWRAGLFWACAAMGVYEALDAFSWASNFNSADVSRLFGWYILARMVVGFALVIWLAAVCFNLHHQRRDPQMPNPVRQAIFVLMAAPFLHLGVILLRTFI